MIIFMLKKNFCDGWDNMFSMIAGNILVLAVGIGFYFAIGALIDILPLSLLVFAIGIICISILASSININAAQISNFKSPSIKDIILNIPSVWKEGVVFGLICSALILLGAVGIPFYLSMNTMFGIFLASVLFWGIAIFVLALQWFLPIRAQMKNGIVKSLKKCFLLLFDNLGFSIFLFFYNLILTVLSVFLFFLIPSVSGLLVAQNNALRLRLYKYDYLEEHPELTTKKQRNKVPWAELIADDYETLGPRPLKSFIFPWK